MRLEAFNEALDFVVNFRYQIVDSIYREDQLTAKTNENEETHE